MLPEVINIGSKNLSLMLVVFIISVICWGFVLWGESKKDGFNSERFFDLIFISIVFSGVISYFLYKLIERTKIFHPNSSLLYFDQDLFLGMAVLLVSVIPIFFFSKKYKWSYFRILDIYSVGFCLSLIIIGLGRFLIFGEREYFSIFFLNLILFMTIMRFRGYKFMSGVIFSIFLLFLSVSLFTFFRKSGYLLLGPFLVTMSLLNLYFRSKKTMGKSIFPKNFISGLKKKLISKEKRLVEEQQSLIKNDPYLQHGRATDNAETMDDVLEDTGKTITDARLGIVRGAKVQVRKALTAIKLGKYGKCEVCGKDIDKARLEVYPEATTCIECATDHSQVEDVRNDELLEKSL